MSLKDLVVGRPSSSPPAAPTAPDLADVEATQERPALVDDDEGSTTIDASAYAHEEKVIVRPNADGTSELDADDILEVEELAATKLQEDDGASLDIFSTLTPKKKNPVAALLDRARGVASARAAVEAEARAKAAAEHAAREEAEAARRAAIAAEQARQRQIMELTAPARDYYPSSITPMALDVSPEVHVPPPPRVPSFPPQVLTQTLGMQQRPSLGNTGTNTYLNRLPMKRPGLEAYVAAGALAAFALIGGIALIAALGFSRSSASGDTAPAKVARPMVIEAANEGTILKPIFASDKVGGSSESPASHAVASVHAVAPSSGEHAAAPAAATPAPAPAQRKSGVIRVSPLLRGVLVDGAPHAVHGGAVVVTCGRHTVKAPGGAAHVVDVPCGGSTSI